MTTIKHCDAEWPAIAVLTEGREIVTKHSGNWFSADQSHFVVWENIYSQTTHLLRARKKLMIKFYYIYHFTMCQVDINKCTVYTYALTMSSVCGYV